MEISQGALSIRPKILVWNFGYSIWRMEQYFPVVEQNSPRPSRSKFRAKKKNSKTKKNIKMADSVILFLELLDYSEVEYDEISSKTTI